MILMSAILKESYHLLMASSVYVILGLAVSGLIRVFLNPASVANHLGKGRFSSVFKAALLGIPLPLCSCGVLPAAISLKKQGANNGATTAFLISTPETGVDSISITYALLDPMLTIVRPLAAFISAISAGFAENIFHGKNIQPPSGGDLSCPVDGCCDGLGRPPEGHKAHHSILEKIGYGVRYAFSDVWNDMAPWFAFGLLLAGAITVFIPEEALAVHLGGGVPSMLIMLVLGIPIYICATASTPIAAALILKGVSPGAALVFLLAGPATNVTSLTVLLGILGKRATGIYLATIAVSAVIFGLFLDQCYGLLDISAKVVAGHSVELIPIGIQWIGSGLLIVLSIKPILNAINSKFKSILRVIKSRKNASSSITVLEEMDCHSSNCGCSSKKVAGPS